MPAGRFASMPARALRARTRARYAMTKPAELARAFWIAEPGRGEIRAEPLPALAATDALVRTLYSGISRGTESLVFKGRVPRSEFARMRAPFQTGDFPAP